MTKSVEKNGTPKAKSTLAKAQVRILTALSKASGPINSATLAAKADVPKTHITGFTRVKYATKRTPALCEQGFARVVELDIDGKKETAYVITASGRKALEKVKSAK